MRYHHMPARISKVKKSEEKKKKKSDNSMHQRHNFKTMAKTNIFFRNI